MRDDHGKTAGGDATVVVAATVTAVGVDPELRHPLRRHLVRLRIDRTLSGESPGAALTLLVHSPSRTFADPDPVGSSFLLTLEPPLTEPYCGPVDVAELADDADTGG